MLDKNQPSPDCSVCGAVGQGLHEGALCARCARSERTCDECGTKASETVFGIGDDGLCEECCQAPEEGEDADPVYGPAGYPAGVMELMRCDTCDTPLEEGRIGLCDDCLDQQPKSALDLLRENADEEPIHVTGPLLALLLAAQTGYGDTLGVDPDGCVYEQIGDTLGTFITREIRDTNDAAAPLGQQRAAAIRAMQKAANQLHNVILALHRFDGEGAPAALPRAKAAPGSSDSLPVVPLLSQSAGSATFLDENGTFRTLPILGNLDSASGRITPAEGLSPHLRALLRGDDAPVAQAAEAAPGPLCCPACGSAEFYVRETLTHRFDAEANTSEALTVEEVLVECAGCLDTNLENEEGIVSAYHHTPADTPLHQAARQVLDTWEGGDLAAAVRALAAALEEA